MTAGREQDARETLRAEAEHDALVEQRVLLDAADAWTRTWFDSRPRKFEDWLRQRAAIAASPEAVEIAAEQRRAAASPPATTGAGDGDYAWQMRQLRRDKTVCGYDPGDGRACALPTWHEARMPHAYFDKPAAAASPPATNGEGGPS